MSNWFTVERVDDTTYAISEYKHWEETHCYLLIGDDKSLLIDTGLGVGNIKDVVCKLTDKEIQVVTTHAHWDHVGGHKYFKNIYIYYKEYQWLKEKFPISLDVVKNNIMAKPCDFPDYFDINKYEIFRAESIEKLYDTDEIDLGNRIIKIIPTPGHSPGHICFYDIKKKYLFSGDLIYKGKLDMFYPTTNPVDFMKSIKNVKKLDIYKVLPGHHEINISTTLIDDIDKGLTTLVEEGKLKHGQGIFKFDDFTIHV